MRWSFPYVFIRNLYSVIPDSFYRESILVYIQADPRPCQRLQGQAHNLLVCEGEINVFSV